MTRITIGFMAAAFTAASLSFAAAQVPAPAPAGKMKLSRQSLKEMKAKWSANRGKLKACRKEVKVKGLAGDDRWFYIEECMGRS